MTPVMLDKNHADRREGLFGGTKAVFVWDILPGPPSPFSAVLACELEPGGRVGKHLQQRDPEIVICTGGEGVALVNDVAHPLTPGAAVALPHGQSLAFENTSEDTPFCYLIIKAALTAE